MSFLIESAIYERNDDCMRIQYSVKIPGIGVSNHIDYLSTRPRGDWSQLFFKREDQMSYPDFLNTMVEKNVEVCRKMAKLQLDTVLKDNVNNYRLYIRLMKIIRILDPSFEPPILNMKCGWQKQLLREICSGTTFHVIGVCQNCHRLTRYFNVLKTVGV